MKHKYILLSLLAVLLITLSGCSSDKKASTENYQTITASEAKEMMEKDSSIIILDVRTEEEYLEEHIKGSRLISYTDISDKAEELLTDKDATILVYCRSGRRSAIATQSLVDLGYTKIYDFGGINDWPYEVVTE